MHLLSPSPFPHLQSLHLTLFIQQQIPDIFFNYLLSDTLLSFTVSNFHNKYVIF